MSLIGQRFDRNRMKTEETWQKANGNRTTPNQQNLDGGSVNLGNKTLVQDNSKRTTSQYFQKKKALIRNRRSQKLMD